MVSYLDFERPVAELEAKIGELKRQDNAQIDLAPELEKLEAKARKQLRELYARLTPWQKTLVARHGSRPRFTDIVPALFDEYLPLAGDRTFGEDRAILGGMARFRGRACIVMGHEKGSNTDSRLRHNFGMAKPEGYRKAVRLMTLADRFKLPVFTFIDTPGAFPGVEAEERGQAEAIARATEACLALGTPLISVIVGEGGSGGAVALATGNRVLMLEHSIYSVISPEGCASILWRTADKAQDAAQALKLTAQDLLALGVIDSIISEPMGGAHRDVPATLRAIGKAIETALGPLEAMSSDQLRADRRGKYLAMGAA